MFEPRLVAWYQADQTRIDGLTLNAYLLKLSQLVLEKNWAHDILETILFSSQGDRIFINWKIEMENLNAILTTAAPVRALSRDQLRVQLQSNLHPDMRLSLSLEPVMVTNLAAWAFEVKEHDDRMRGEDARTQKLIDASTAAHMVRCSKKFSRGCQIHCQHPPPLSNPKRPPEPISRLSQKSRGPSSRTMMGAQGVADSMLGTISKIAQ